MRLVYILIISYFLVGCSNKTGMGFEKGSEVSITLFDPLMFPNGKGLEQFEHLYIHKVTSEMVIVKTEKGERIQIPIEKIRSIDDGLGGGIEFARNFEEPVTEVKAELGGVNYKELEFRGFDKIAYHKGSPYTGKVIIYYENGKKEKEANYKDGKLDGLHVFWHENGQKSWEGNYKDGKEDGLLVEWYENGEKMQEGNWKDGERDGLSVWRYINGQKMTEENFKDGKMDGLALYWYRNGQKSSEANYKDGKEDELVVTWHENGQKAIEANYKDGEKVSAKYWNSKGEPVDTIEEARK